MLKNNKHEGIKNSNPVPFLSLDVLLVFEMSGLKARKPKVLNVSKNCITKTQRISNVVKKVNNNEI